MQDPIEKVIERCRYRIDRSLDCNIADVIRLIEEVEKRKTERVQIPPWAGLGSGD